MVELSRRTFVKIGVGALSASATAARTPQAEPQIPASRIAALDENMPGLMKRFNVRGIAVSIVQRDRRTWTKGYGITRTDDGAAITADTVFEAASLGKPVFAYLVLKLAEEKGIDLDGSVGPFFRAPDFLDNPGVDAITPRIVLSHRTGLANWRRPEEADRLRFTPGTAFSYSGEAYVRLQRAIEKATNRSFNELITERLFKPWGMSHSSYVWRPDFEALAAEGHDGSGKRVRTRLWGFKPDGAQGPETPPMMAIPNAAASLYSTVTDYSRFVSLLLMPPAPDAAHLTRRSLEAMMTAEARVTDALSWGLGWGLTRVESKLHLWHWGNNGVYQNFVTACPDTGLAITMFTNSANGLRLIREAMTSALGLQHPAFAWDRVVPQG